MTLALGVLFWVLALVVIVLAIMQRTYTSVIWVLVFIMILALGIAEFGALHFVK